MSNVSKLCTAVGLLFGIASLGFAGTAGIVIENSTGEIITRCVEFEEAEITVDVLLELSGFKTVITETSFGDALCFLHNDGIANEGDCFGHPLGWFWELFVHNGTEWESSPVGIGETIVTDGSLIGFDFGAFGENALPPMNYEDVCGYTSTAAIVVDHSDGSHKVVHVEFAGETVTGTQLLQKSGLDVSISASSFGDALCSLDGEGQPESDCFGDALGRYWGFNILTETNEWTFSAVGIGEATIRDGDITGFIFAEFGVAQPPVTHDEIFGQTSNVETWDMYQ